MSFIVRGGEFLVSYFQYWVFKQEGIVVGCIAEGKIMEFGNLLDVGDRVG